MTSHCRENCREAIDLSSKLIDLTAQDHADCDHEACMVLCGIILDSASVIRRAAENRLKLLNDEN